MSPSSESPDTPVIVAVVRTGGVAGIRRRWQVEPDRGETSRWIALIDECPWDGDAPETSDGASPSPGAPPRGADRFVWLIRARTPAAKHEQQLGDSELDGPWRDLVDAVRAASD